MENLSYLFVLLIAFQVKHWLADYLLHLPSLLDRNIKEHEKQWWVVLFAHSFFHSFLTGLIIIVSNYTLWYLLVIDLFGHLIIDGIRSHPKLLGRYNHIYFHYWKIMGLDQMGHHLTHYLIIYLLMTI